jgi:aspartyl-tRNA(Asn)/glutamyl-tRNA(Gln) amidotransferase subunit B
MTRQTKLLAAKKKIVRETRHYDEERGVTMPGRDKEFEEDYGYIGEPDLGTYRIGPMAESMMIPETPIARSKRMASEHGIAPSSARQIVMTDWELADLYEILARKIGNDAALGWTLGALTSNWKELKARDSPELRAQLVDIVTATVTGSMTDSEARMRISALSGGKEVSAPVEQSGDLDAIIVRLVDQHPEVVKDFKGNEKAANFLIGQVMKETKGQYSSKVVAERMKKELEKWV